MQRVRVLEFKVEPAKVFTNKQFKIKLKLDEIERGQYARQTGTVNIDLYAGEPMGRI